MMYVLCMHVYFITLINITTEARCQCEYIRVNTVQRRISTPLTMISW